SAIWSPWPGPTAMATRPSVAMRRSASNSPRGAIAPRRTSIESGAGSIRVSRGISVALGDPAGFLQVVVVVDLGPPARAEPCGRDLAAAVHELLVAVLVVEVRVALPGGLQRVGERSGRGRLQQRGADVLTVRARRVHELGDTRQVPVAVEDDLHLLVGEL